MQGAIAVIAASILEKKAKGLIPKTSLDIKAYPDPPEAVPTPGMESPILTTRDAYAKYPVGKPVRDIMSGLEGIVAEPPQGEFGDVLFVTCKSDGQTYPVRVDQIEEVKSEHCPVGPQAMPPAPSVAAPEAAAMPPASKQEDQAAVKAKAAEAFRQRMKARRELEQQAGNMDDPTLVSAPADDRHLHFGELKAFLQAKEKPAMKDAVEFFGYIPEEWDTICAALRRDAVVCQSQEIAASVKEVGEMIVKGMTDDEILYEGCQTSAKGIRSDLMDVLADLRKTGIPTELTIAGEEWKKIKDKLKNLYRGVDEFKMYDKYFKIAQKFGYPTADKMWEADPMVPTAIKEQYKFMQPQDVRKQVASALEAGMAPAPKAAGSEKASKGDTGATPFVAPPTTSFQPLKTPEAAPAQVKGAAGPMPTTPPPAGKKYIWDQTMNAWTLVQASKRDPLAKSMKFTAELSKMIANKGNVVQADYQGWSNYATWGVALIINNDQGLQEEAHGIVKEHGRKIDTDEVLRLWVEDMVRGDSGNQMQQQLLSAAISEINWKELTNSFADDLEAEGVEVKADRFTSPPAAGGDPVAAIDGDVATKDHPPSVPPTAGAPEYESAPGGKPKDPGIAEPGKSEPVAAIDGDIKQESHPPAVPPTAGKPEYDTAKGGAAQPGGDPIKSALKTEALAAPGTSAPKQGIGDPLPQKSHPTAKPDPQPGKDAGYDKAPGGAAKPGGTVESKLKTQAADAPAAAGGEPVAAIDGDLPQATHPTAKPDPQPGTGAGYETAQGGPAKPGGDPMGPSNKAATVESALQTKADAPAAAGGEPVAAIDGDLPQDSHPASQPPTDTGKLAMETVDTSKPPSPNPEVAEGKAPEAMAKDPKAGIDGDIPTAEHKPAQPPTAPEGEPVVVPEKEPKGNPY